MKKILRALILPLVQVFLPKGMRNSLRLWTILELPSPPLETIVDFSNGPIVVLAPHMDDEIIGPGGTIKLHSQAGAHISVLMLTDGARGDVESPTQRSDPQETAHRRERLIQLRKSESRVAAEIVGINEIEFFDVPDGSLKESPEFVEKLAAQLEQRRPTIIYLPALTDNHPDHWAANRILRLALDRLPRDLLARLTIRGYEIWPPLPANRIADITAVAAIKEKAIAAFGSQLKLNDFVTTSMSLNRYRSMWASQGRGFAEAFLETTVQEYRDLYQAICLRTAPSNGRIR